jgi:enoyl-CoA hydratase/3-hydroxyacyl-CoA dehydrogenase
VGSNKMKIDEIDTVLFVGAGTMGCANSLIAAVSGYDVILHDANKEILQTVIQRHEGVAAYMMKIGYCSSDAITAARTRVSLVSDFEEAASKPDLVSESVFENREVKREIHRRLDESCPADAILTTNTSALLVSEIEDAVGRRERFAALHSHLGAPLVDIVRGQRTSPETIDVLTRYVVSLGGVPLVLKREHRGYVFNALNGPVLAMALRLLLENRASMEDVDRAWMSDRQAPMGPFGLMDLFGLDLMRDSWQNLSIDPHREELRSLVEPFLNEYVAAGRLGVKTGEGFYDYSAPGFQEPHFLSAEPISQVASDALTVTLVRGALFLRKLDVATRQDIELAWTAATGYSMGPFAIAEDLGPDRFRDTLDRQVESGLLSREAASEMLMKL